MNVCVCRIGWIYIYYGCKSNICVYMYVVPNRNVRCMPSICYMNLMCILCVMYVYMKCELCANCGTSYMLGARGKHR